MNFQYNYNLSGSDRKPLVEAVSQILGQPAVYQGAPSFAYIIGDYIVDRNGALRFKDGTGPGAIGTVVEALRGRGFEAENAPEPTGGADGSSPCSFTVEVPQADFTPLALENLRKIVASKEGLLKKVLGADRLLIVESGDRLCFPWFTLSGVDGEADAYSRLITAICRMAKAQKRVTATEKPAPNTKYGMRMFLIRLGFIGDEYKCARRILLRNLAGNSSWKSGHRPEQPAGSTENAGPGGPPLAAENGQEEPPEEAREVQPMTDNHSLGRHSVERVQEMYPAGCRVELVRMDDPYCCLKPGDRGTVSAIDDTGTIFVNWDSGSCLGVIYGVDQVRKL